MIRDQGELISLFDLDSTLADFHLRMCENLELIRSPTEDPWDWVNNWSENAFPGWLKARMKLIKSTVGFWRNLPRLEAGFDILKVANDFGFTSQILTRGPAWHPAAFSEKVEWCAQHVPDLHVNLVRNKSQHYGRILVDDWPDYFMKWLEVRPRGWVVAVLQPWNKHVEHPRLIKYYGNNLDDVLWVFDHVRKTVLGE